MKKPHFSLKIKIALTGTLYVLLMVGLLYTSTTETNEIFTLVWWLASFGFVVVASIHFPVMVSIEEKEHLNKETETLIEMEKRLISNINQHTEQMKSLTVISVGLAIFSMYFFVTAATIAIKMYSLLALLGVTAFWLVYYLKISKKIKMFDGEKHTYEVVRQMIMSLINENEATVKKLYGLLKV